MTTRAESVQIGPFIGGLNTYGDASTIGDSECAELTNFDVDLDGSLKSRPPISVKSTYAGNHSIRYIGNYTTFSGIIYLIYSSIATVTPRTVAYNPLTDVFTTITTTFGATSMVQYQNKAWLVAAPNSANPGGSWDGTTFVAVATMPKGISATIYKERMFVGSGGLSTNPGRVTFSNPANPALWTGTDFFDVKNGDGQDIIKIHAYSGAIVIFKTTSTYTFAYESAPTKGQVQGVSATLGLDGIDCMVEDENIIYVLSNGDLYSITNWNWQQLNIKVPFTYINAHTGFTYNNFSVSSINNRIICRYFDSYYIYGTKTKVWSKWLTSLTPNKFIMHPLADVATGKYTYYAGNYLNDDTTTAPQKIFKIQDTHTPTEIESFDVILKTKTYNIDSPYSFKRLMWWGVDLTAKSIVNSIATPVSYGYPVTWANIVNRNLKWIDRENYTWGAPLNINLDVTDYADIKNFDGVRMLVKYKKSFRFRQVQFKLSSTVNGTTDTGPLSIFSIIALVINKQTVPKKIN